MKTVLKILGGIIGLVLLAAGGFALFINSDWPVKREAPKVELKVEATPARLARGKQLVAMRCYGCHFDQHTGAMTGHQMVDAPLEFGAIFSHNITKHPTKGAGRYSDGELLVLLRTGIRRDGVFSGPFMQSALLGDEDLLSIIAFMRSDDPWVEAKDVDDKQWQPTFLAKMLMHVAFKPTPMPKEKIAVPDVKDAVTYGRYVVNAMGDCFACHSADFKTMNTLEPEKSAGYLGGGNQTLDGSRSVVPTANLTMDPETGIGKWTEEQFVKTVRTGIRFDGQGLRYPMVPYAALTDDEAKAAFAYLKTVPIIKNAVARAPAPMAAANASDGEKFYNKYACYSCHGKAGVGICDLRGASKTYDSDDKLAAFIHDPSKFVPGTMMPTWAGTIAEPDYASLIAYVHTLEKAAGGSAGKGAAPSP